MTSGKHVRQFERQNIREISRTFTYFKDLPQHKKLAHSLINDEQKRKYKSKLEYQAALWPARTDPRTGLPDKLADRMLNGILNKLNKDGYSERWPLFKVFSLPDTDGTTTAGGTPIVRDHLKVVYGKRIDEVIARLDAIAEGIQRQIDRLGLLQKAGQKKILQQIEKYRQQLVAEAQMRNFSKKTKGKAAGVQ